MTGITPQALMPFYIGRQNMMYKVINITAITAVTGLVLFCNLYFPGYYHFEFLFLIPVMLTVWMPVRRLTLNTGIVCSVLLIISAADGDYKFNQDSLMYISVPLLCIWIFTYVVFLYKKQTETSDIFNQRLNAMFNNATEGIVISTTAGNMIMVNPKAEDMFGYQHGRLQGEQIELLVPEATRASHRKHRSQYSTEGHSRAMGKGLTLYGRKKDGSHFPVEISLSTFSIADELYIISFIIDITERKRQEDLLALAHTDLEKRVEERTRELAGVNISLQNAMKERIEAEEALRTSERLFNAIAGNFPNGFICVLDRNYQYVFIDGTELRKLGFTRTDLQGKSLSQEPVLPFDRSVLDEVFEDKNAHFDIEIRNNIYSVTSVPLPDSKGVIKNILLVVQNVTEVRDAVREIRESLGKERELNELKSKFVAIASHEFRTPLSTILSSVTLLEKYNNNNDREKHLKHVERIKSSVKNLTEILNDFLSLEKLEAGKVEAHMDEFNLVQFASDLCEEMQVSARSGQEIVYRHSGDTEMIYLDKYLLRNICINLLNNAIKYSPEGTPVELITETGDKLTVTIRDSGLGIPPGDQQHLFERFFRGSNVTAIQGTGLGLNIVNSYVKLMDGKISFKSEVNEGSEFILTFPRQVISEIH